MGEWESSCSRGGTHARRSAKEVVAKEVVVIGVGFFIDHGCIVHHTCLHLIVVSVFVCLVDQGFSSCHITCIKMPCEAFAMTMTNGELMIWLDEEPDDDDDQSHQEMWMERRKMVQNTLAGNGLPSHIHPNIWRPP